MKRWNGWGEETIAFDVPPAAQELLERAVGRGTPPRDVAFDDVVSSLPASRLSGWPGLVTEPKDRLLHARGQSFPDWVAVRSGAVGRVPDGVIYPETAEEVRQILARARAGGAHLIPYGGGTSVVGHLSPPSEGPPVVSVDLRRLSSCRRLDAESGLATFGAGVTGPELEARLRVDGFTLGHFPQSFEYSTLGGWIVTRSSGQESLGYGRIERLFAGGRLEAPAGPLDLPVFPASAAGPDLREMVLGSEGRLGFLTEATVRVTRQSECEEVHGAFLPGWQAGIGAMRSILQSGLHPSMLRLSSPEETRTLFALSGHAGLVRWLNPILRFRGVGDERAFLLAGFKGSPRSVRGTREEVLSLVRRFGGVSLGKRPGRSWLRSRFTTPYLRNTLWELGYAVDTLETACPWSSVAGLVRSVEDAVRSAFLGALERCHVFTHLSHPYPDGSSFYVTLVFRLGPDPRETLAIWRLAKEAASRAIGAGGGTISHHHGVGVEHRAYLEHEKGRGGMDVLRALAGALDPHGLMNPGSSSSEPAGVHEMGSRGDALCRIAGPWDVLIVGGGITGAGIAMEAARNGLRTLLVEKHDFAWGTSSRSGKLVHGGLRYLKQGKLLLTRESVCARDRLLRDGAGLVEELTFLLPVYRGDRPGRSVYAAGLWLYDLLAGRVTHRWHDAGGLLRLAPSIARDGLVGGFQYRDAKADDARLVLRVLREAEHAGATVVNYLGVVELLRDADMVVGADLRDETTGRTFEVRARAVANATGAWSDTLRGQVGRPPRQRPLRGSHLVFPECRFPLTHAVGFLHPVDRRPLYALPWEGATLVGTTDVEHRGLSGEDEPRIAAVEFDYLMEALKAQFPGLDLQPSDAVATFSGVRPVVGTGQEDPSKESRDSVLWEESGLITVTGGKLTTFHVTARAALGLILRRLGRPSPVRARPVFDPFPQDPLAGARVPLEDALRLRARYGGEAPAIVDAARDGELLRIPGLPALWAERRWAARVEWVVHLDDLLLRRVRLGLLSPRGGAAGMPFVREICRTELDWDETRWEAELRRYMELWERWYSVPGETSMQC